MSRSLRFAGPPLDCRKRPVWPNRGLSRAVGAALALLVLLLPALAGQGVSAVRAAGSRHPRLPSLAHIPCCTWSPPPTLTQETRQADLVLVGTLRNANEKAQTTEIVVEGIFKDHA